MSPATDPKRTDLRATPTTFDTGDGYPGSAEPGAFEFVGYSTLVLACPGCGHVSAMRVGNPKPLLSPSWELGGTPTAPTLRPSINCVGCCGWHGYLTDGVFRSC